MDRESLFSLELVVEKIYIPHVVCRFPAVAFRLLDFPTILIEHVENDLSEKIKYKISRDPYYKVPPQFPELRDKHGNFLVRKGKSCLFKISTDTLKTHLASTPMYVMVLDNFENVPKLIGNSTIPLDETMEEIVNDIKTMGNTVPSVHGDKGLFKIFSLMGKEIGYVILGYRLLSLGPGLIPHIPESAIAKRASERKVIDVKPVEVESTPRMRSQMMENLVRKENLVHTSTQEMGSMTEPEKCDVLLQTVDMIDKEIHVAIGGAPEIVEDAEEKDVKEYHTLATQTDKRKHKRKQQELNVLDVDIDSDDDGVILSNIVQPPALFYNSKNEPKVKIQHQFVYDDDDSSVYTDDLVVENLSDDEEEKKDDEKVVNERERKMERQDISVNNQVNIAPSINRQSRPLHFPDLASQIQSGPLFPMLTALLNELSCLQNPAFVQQTVRQVQSAVRAQPQTRPAELKPVKTFVKPSVPAKVQKPVKTVMKQDTKENDEQDSVADRSKRQKSVRVTAQPPEIVPKQKGWIRKAPEMGVKKSKLAYGLTNTQRLRLAKVNPEWLKTIEKEEMEAKALKQRPALKPKQEEEFPTGEISDTLTEVRRLAEKNLNAEDTLAQSDISTLKLSTKKHKSPIRKGGRHSPLRKRSKSPKQKKITTESKKPSESINKKDNGNAYKGEYSPHADDEHSDGDDDTPSGRSQKSIEVRIPSAQVYQDDSDYTVNESDAGQEMYRPESKFPGFIDQDTSLPESIDGVINRTLDEKDDDSPLESTRNEREIRGVKDAKMFRSTDDYDTQLTEPELKNLLSSGEKSVISDEMSSDTKSPSPVQPSNSLVAAKFQVLNPKASLQSPIPALRKSNIKFESEGKASPGETPRTPRSPSPVASTTSKLPTPRPRKTGRERRLDFKHESIHTESVSSYVPSDNDDETYSDDFQGGATDDDVKSRLSTPELTRKFIPSTKLGYTIH